MDITPLNDPLLMTAAADTVDLVIFSTFVVSIISPPIPRLYEAPKINLSLP
jgi:hypothetical protein